MLANIRQHAAYIASTIGYVDDQIAADARIITEASVRVQTCFTDFSCFFYSFFCLFIRRLLEDVGICTSVKGTFV